jgi:hypothetical protein
MIRVGKIAFSDGKHFRYCSIEGKNLPALSKTISKDKTIDYTKIKQHSQMRYPHYQMDY